MMETKWARFIKASVQVFALISVWHGASAMVANGVMTEPLLLRFIDPLAIPATLLAVIGSVAATQLRLRGRRKVRKVVHEEHIEPVQSIEKSLYIQQNELLITELKKQVIELSKDKEHLIYLLQERSARLREDPLTGIPNRLAYEEQFQQEFQRWKRFGNPLTFLIWDIDHFKKINDYHGHAIGDEILRMVAQQISSRLRSTDFLARYGGEEFIMLLPGADVNAAHLLADQIRLHIAECEFRQGNTRVSVTISCGLSSFEPGDGLQSVFKRADQALYQAKSAGRNCCWIS
ncbi:MAG TPA: GGDEF domain-containing protein [Candidatus Competibacteraceae bacterium]|nr:GGDEF domain-containing protein [Candidatus Competibacteraceae bacterium]